MRGSQTVRLKFNTPSIQVTNFFYGSYASALGKPKATETSFHVLEFNLFATFFISPKAKSFDILKIVENRKVITHQEERV